MSGVNRNGDRWRTIAGLVVVFAVVGGGAWGAAGDAKFMRVERDFTTQPQSSFAEDRFIVVLEAEARGVIQVGVGPANRPTVNLPSLQDVIDRQGIARFERQFPTARPQAAGSRFHDLSGHYKAHLAPGRDLDRAVQAFARNPHVARVEKVGIHPVSGCATGTPRTPNDTYFDNPPPTFNFPQWDLWDTWGIDADLAWTVETGDASVVVVAMDSGTRYNHADLGGPDPPGPGDIVTNGNIWVNPGEIPGNGTDDDGNGKADDVVGWDFVSSGSFCSSGEDCSTPDNDPADFNGHGTHVAGTMAAITNNAGGVAGVAGGFGDGTSGSAGNGAKILVTRIGWDSILGGFVAMDFAAEAMNYVTDLKLNHGVNIVAVNASWGSSNSGGLGAAVDNLLAADIMLIHAAGNDNSSTADYLGGRTDVLNVAATDQGGVRASFSNFGSWVDIAAPGVGIISTYHNSADPANDYVAVLDGTSMAAPHVAGVAALLESCDPALSGPQKFSLMVNNTCTPNSSNIGGLLNAKLALDAAGCSGCSIDDDCDDNDACNGLETCSGGTCQAGTPVNCDDSNACTADSCDPATGSCSNDPIDCGDGDLCTVDSCDPMTGCANDPVTCPMGETCDPGTGNCVPAPVCNNNGTCEDGEHCTNCPNDCVSGTSSGAFCGNGVCEAGDGEDCVSCPSDCNGRQGGKPSNRFCCGDGEGQNPVSCADSRCSTAGFQCTDVPQPGGSFCCGNGTCESGEGCGNCAVDCAEPAEVCDDGIDNDCNGVADCDDGACSGLPQCQSVDCSTITNKSACNAEATCRWDNRNKVCVPN